MPTVKIHNNWTIISLALQMNRTTFLLLEINIGFVGEKISYEVAKPIFNFLDYAKSMIHDDVIGKLKDSAGIVTTKVNGGS